MPKTKHPEIDITSLTVATPDGKIEVPLDQQAIGELQQVFGKLTFVQQEWLLTRFSFADSDQEASETLAARGRTFSHSTLKTWKSKDKEFVRAYTLLSGRLIDWARYAAIQIEAGNAILGAQEARRLLLVPWDKLDSRGTSAKMQAAQAALDRVIGKEQEVNVNIVRLADIVPRGR